MIPATEHRTLPQPLQRASTRAKIAIIGGGSLYSAHLLLDMLKRSDQIKGSQITLMDTNEEQLQLIHRFGTQLFQQAGADLTLEQTTSDEEAISDASFVISTFRTGGLKAQHLDETLPLQHNIIGHDLLGPGGFFAAMRMTPTIAGIAATIEKLAPTAFLLNHTDPNNIVTEAIAQTSGLRIIGVRTDSPQQIAQLAMMAGIPLTAETRLYPRTIGLNQENWTTAVWHQGSDILPQIVQWCREFLEKKPEITAQNYATTLQLTLTAIYEAIPSSYMVYYYFPEQILYYIRQQTSSRAEELLHRHNTLLSLLQTEANKEQQRTALQHYLPDSDCAIDVLCAILHDTGDELVLNVPNQGALKFLAEDRVVKVPCRVDARGAMPLSLGDGGLALDQRGLIFQLAEYAGATARAALWGNRRDAIRALATNPLVMGYGKAEVLYDTMAAAHASCLPERLLK